MLSNLVSQVGAMANGSIVFVSNMADLNRIIHVLHGTSILALLDAVLHLAIQSCTSSRRGYTLKTIESADSFSGLCDLHPPSILAALFGFQSSVRTCFAGIYHGEIFGYGKFL